MSPQGLVGKICFLFLMLGLGEDDVYIIQTPL